MISDLVELLGFACLIAGVLVLAGLGWALVCACPCLLFVGAGIDDAATVRGASSALARMRGAAVHARAIAAARWPAKKHRVKAA